LSGKPLLGYVVDAVSACKVIDRLVLSTDCEAIAELGLQLGLEVPFRRPAALAADDTPMLPVIQHAVREIEAAGWPVDVVVLLQPTAPLRTGDQIRSAVEMLLDSRADSVVSVVELPLHLSPDYVLRLEGDVLVSFIPGGNKITRRQDARRAYVRDGTVYATRRDVLMIDGSIYGSRCLPLAIDPSQSITLDTPTDWAAAEALLAARKLTPA
jgi:CMP-N-acetylneuraminic acid synthetase